MEIIMRDNETQKLEEVILTPEQQQKRLDKLNKEDAKYDDLAEMIEKEMEDTDKNEEKAPKIGLSTGFDAPKTDVARPTAFIVLYSQMIGRGLRGQQLEGR